MLLVMLIILPVAAFFLTTVWAEKFRPSAIRRCYPVHTSQRSTPMTDNSDRRLFLYRFGAGFALLFGLRPAAAQPQGAIEQPVGATPQRFVRRAFALRDLAADSGDQAYGALLVQNDRVVGQAPSRVVVNHDPTAHAEMEAIRDAARRLGRRDLSGCIMYSSSRPCPMCEAAAYWAGVERLFYGNPASDGGRPRLTRC